MAVVLEASWGKQPPEVVVMEVAWPLWLECVARSPFGSRHRRSYNSSTCILQPSLSRCARRYACKPVARAGLTQQAVASASVELVLAGAAVDGAGRLSLEVVGPVGVLQAAGMMVEAMVTAADMAKVEEGDAQAVAARDILVVDVAVACLGTGEGVAMAAVAGAAEVEAAELVEAAVAPVVEALVATVDKELEVEAGSTPRWLQGCKR